MAIRFGTSGWRAIIADEFTFANVQQVTRAICTYLKSVNTSGTAPLLAVGRDTRFLGEQFVEACVAEATAAGLSTLVCSEPAPTPAFSHVIRSNKAAGGINFTASHNPAQYNGMKFSTADGAPALPDVTQQVEALLAHLQPERAPSDVAVDTTRRTHEVVAGTASSESHDPRPAYLADIASKVRFDVIARANRSYAYDPLWGAGRGYLNEALRQHGIEVHTIHDWRDVLFGGRAPEPDDEHLDELRAVMRDKGCVLGLATDGDADRFGLIDTDGTYITPNKLIAVLFDYLAETRGGSGGVARSVATSNLVDRIAEKRGLPVYETPVGFKYIGDLINKDKIIIGGEESAGLSIRGHYPEKDGILACLLAAEAVAARGASLGEQLKELYRTVGQVESERIGVRLTLEIAATLADKLRRDPAEFAGRRVVDVNRLDGVKFLLSDGSWLLLRPSGTEPLVRIYAESQSHDDLEVLLEQGRKYLLD